MVCSVTNDKGILIKNIYYMLTYAFQVLRQSNYESIAAEKFNKIEDLFAAILSKGIARQLKQGLYREYIPQCEDLTIMRGKLDLFGTIHHKLQKKPMLSCEYDELSENNIFNQVLKTTALILLHQPSVRSERRKSLKKIMLFFENVETMDSLRIKWSMFHFQKSNRSYKMLLNICRFVLNGLLLTTEKGNYKMAAFLDEQNMARLYEKFVLGYFRYHYPELNAHPAQIAWNLDRGVANFLPRMQTDITMKHNEKTLIIDTKYYARTMQLQARYDSRTLHSNNMYQIFSYVKNQDAGNTGNVAGLLLYAKTGESLTPDCDFLMGGNKISVKTLDLNAAFSEIAAQLNNIAESYFGETAKD